MTTIMKVMAIRTVISTGTATIIITAPVVTITGRSIPVTGAMRSACW